MVQEEKSEFKKGKKEKAELFRISELMGKPPKCWPLESSLDEHPEF